MAVSSILAAAEKADRQAFVQRRGPSAAFQTSLFSNAEMDALNCNSVENDDSEARFAKQYQTERESMRRTESGYLLLQQSSGASLVVPVSTTRKSRSNSSPAFVIA